MRGSSEFNLTSILLWKNLHSTVICINHPKICFFLICKLFRKIHRHKKVTMRKQKGKFNDLQIGSSRLCNSLAVIRAGVRIFTFWTLVIDNFVPLCCLSTAKQFQLSIHKSVFNCCALFASLFARLLISRNYYCLLA